MRKYRPSYLLHGHTHLRYGQNTQRERNYEDTQVINVCERYVLEIPDENIIPSKKKGDLKYLDF